MEPNTQTKVKLNKAGIIAVASVVVILLLAISTSIYFYSKSKATPEGDAIKDLARVTEMVGKLMVLPTDETPTLATVSDPEKLKDQPFFAKAQKGDKVLIYANSQKAILYNPNTNKIVEVAPINTNAGNQIGN